MTLSDPIRGRLHSPLDRDSGGGGSHATLVKPQATKPSVQVLGDEAHNFLLSIVCVRGMRQQDDG